MLARILLAYGVLFIPSSERVKGAPIRTCLHNLGVVLVGAQICLVYFSAAVMKAAGTSWIHGTATFLVSQNDLFTPEPVRTLFKIPAVATLTTYGAMLLQAWFPVALMGRLRKPWLLLAFVFHLWTIIAMRLVTFGLVMIGADLFLMTDREYEALNGMARSIMSSAVAAGRRLAAATEARRAGP